jgi:hypothetical protein
MLLTALPPIPSSISVVPPFIRHIGTSSPEIELRTLGGCGAAVRYAAKRSGPSAGCRLAWDLGQISRCVPCRKIIGEIIRQIGNLAGQFHGRSVKAVINDR